MGLDITGIGAIFDFGSKVIDRIFPDPAARDAAKLELLKQQQAGAFKELEAALTIAQGQMATNQAEASSDDAYTKRWRPTIGYVIGAALAFQYLLNPLLLWAAALFGSDITPPSIALDEHLWELMTGMLGLAGWRTLDKIKGK